MKRMARKIYAPGELVYAEPIHPGELLNDELQARNLSVQEFAKATGTSEVFVADILKGIRPITAEYALKIEAATAIPAFIWVNIQSKYGGV